MKFDDLAWAALLFYYKSSGDKKYSKIITDTSFVSALREAPQEVNVQEFERKVILDYIDIESYDLLAQHKLASTILDKIVELQQDISYIQNITILDYDPLDNDITDKITKICTVLASIYGLWMTGASKIVHLLNDKLLPILNLNIASHVGITEGVSYPTEWLKQVNQDAQAVTNDFREKGLPNSPEAFLSDKLGYTSGGYEKSLIKFLDEYYWLRFGENLPIPPSWAPSQ